MAHYSVQNDHLHLIVEGEDRHDLSAQMRKLFSRIALAVNAIAMRRGSLFRDRHHREELAGPTQMRNALVYVLFNDRKHHAQNGGAITEAMLRQLDDRSSAAWLEGWAPRAGPPPEDIARLRARDGDIEGFGAPCTAPDTWLAQEGWRIARAAARSSCTSSRASCEHDRATLDSRTARTRSGAARAGRHDRSTRGPR